MPEKISITNPPVSICIPAYEMHNQGEAMLSQLLESIYKQTYKNYEIVVSDHSVDDRLEKLCAKSLNVTYIKNRDNKGSSSANINKAVDHASGDFIKPMFQDDLFYNAKSLEEMVELQKVSNCDWLACDCAHYRDSIRYLFNEHPASWINPEHLALGSNSIGSPTCILYKNCPLRFDKELIWLMDCEFYYNLFKMFGPPAIMNKVGIINRVWDKSVSNSIATQQLKQKEFEYVRKKWYL